MAPFNEHVGINVAGAGGYDEIVTIRDTPLETTLNWVSAHELDVVIECQFGDEADCLRTDRNWSVDMTTRWRDVRIVYRPGERLAAVGGPDVLKRLAQGFSKASLR